MVLFHPGQMLVYGNVGVCQVEAVGTSKFLRGESREYYTLPPVYSKHKEKIYLPTGTAAYLRPPVTPQPNQSPAACGGVYHTYKSIPTPAYRPAACVRGFLYPRRLHAMPGYAIIPLSTDYIPARGGTI